MKTKQGRVVAVVGALVVAGSSWVSWAQWQQPTEGKRVQAGKVDEIVKAARAEAALEPVTEKKVPFYTQDPSMPPGNYWMLQQDSPPLPFDPFPELMVFPLGGNSWLVDDRSVDYPALHIWLAAEARARRALLRAVGLGLADASSELALAGEVGLMSLESDPPTPPGGGEGGGTNEPPAYNPLPAYSYPSGALWLEITEVTNGLAYVTVHGTESTLGYQLLSKVELTNGAWALEGGSFLGTAGQDWTARTVAVLDRTNTLFLWACSSADTDGDGLPNWWEIGNGLDPDDPDTGVTGISDGYKDGDNDGWTNLQELQNGTGPASFNTPPAPHGLAVVLTAGGAHANLTWGAAYGGVTGYTIARSFNGNVTQVSGSTTSFADSQFSLPTGLYWSVPKYRIQAHYSGGSSAWSAWTSALESEAPNARLWQGAAGQMQVVAAQIPATAAALRVGQSVAGPVSVTNVDIAVTAFANGVAVLPEPFASLATNLPSGIWWYASWLSTNQAQSAGIQLGRANATPFWDGRTQLRQNLAFLLRVATPNLSFGYHYTNTGGTELFVSSPTNYAFSGFFATHDYEVSSADNVPDVGLEPSRPFVENHCYRNFVFDGAALNGAGLLTGTGLYRDASFGLSLSASPLYQFVSPANPTSIPAVLAAGESEWLNWIALYPDALSMCSDGEIGVTLDWVGDDAYCFISGTSRNLFGLPYVSARYAWGATESERDALTPTHPVLFDFGFLYPETAQPQFQVVGQYLARPGVDWLPGHLAFNATNASPLLVTSIGSTNFTVAAYTRLAITNGYADKPAFLGQYLEAAHTTDANGMATANSAGVVSPYGQFFPTVAGPAALVTMPDPDTGIRSTGIVHVIKLQLDVNHDGEMDLSWTGADTTSTARPFVFWVNNDNDAPDGQELDATTDADCADQVVDGPRDLEDFARLWLVGLPPLSGGGYTVSLHWRNTQGSPAIKLYQAWDTAGGISYLSDTGAAAQQASYIAGGSTPSGCGASIGTAGTTPLTLPEWFFFPAASTKCLLFEAAGIGSGELVLSISKDASLLAETSAWMDLRDVNGLYERAILTNTTSGAISTWTSGIQSVDQAAVTEPDGTEDLMIFVHGFNNSVGDWLNSSDTVFKRLYWAGHHGRFASVHWPCRLLRLDFNVFNDSEVRSYKAGAAMSAYLSQLRTRFPVHRLHILAHSQGNAITSEAIRQGAPFDTYILTQAAMPASSYDVNAPTHADLLFHEQYSHTPEWQPLGYRGAYANFTGRIVNFFNPQDSVLDTWVTDQKLAKPSYGYAADSTSGTNWIGNYAVTDPQESRAHVSRSQTLPIGQSGPASGHGIIQTALDLNAQFDFGPARSEHSAQWTRPIQASRPYFQQTLISCQIQPAP